MGSHTFSSYLSFIAPNGTLRQINTENAATARLPVPTTERVSPSLEPVRRITQSGLGHLDAHETFSNHSLILVPVQRR